MRPEIKKLWTDALRSGEYKQGKSSLIIYHLNSIKEDGMDINFVPNQDDLKNASYCCLGVLCDLYRKHTGINMWKRMSFDDGLGLPPKIVLEWAGLKDNNPIVIFQDKSYTLSSLNDHEKLNFNQIADIIDQQL